jgi:5-hydroxyisourate hydrolase
MAGRLTTHALDTVRGCGAAGLGVTLRGPDGAVLADVRLDDGGRATLIEAGLTRGVHHLTFAAAVYHRSLGVELTDPPFLDEVVISFGVSDPEAHYHAPLLLSPYSYSTYRGG